VKKISAFCETFKNKFELFLFEEPDRRTKYVSPEGTQAQSPHYCFAQLPFSQFPAK